MPRRKLIDYLNNPMLLKDISMEEMKAWADEAPYAGLIQKLLAQKLIIEKAGQKEIDAAKAMSILSNANPKFALRSIEDFKRMILEDTTEDTTEDVSDDAADITSPMITTHSVSDQVEASADSDLGLAKESQKEQDEEVDAHKEESYEQEDDTMDIEPDTSSHDQEDRGQNHDKDDDKTMFTSWLSTLSSIHIEDKEYDVNIELDDEAPISDTLAQLLVNQGHNEEAIEMYEKLILKYPQKSSFFAAQIAKLKEL